MRRHLIRTALLAALALPAIALPAWAQSNIRMIYPYAAGGSGDAVIRILAEKAQGILGQNVLVENRTGGAGRIGVRVVKSSAPDGSTFLFTPFAAVTIYPVVYTTIDYDPFTDLAPVSQICTFDFGIAVRADHPATTPQELIAWLRANPTRTQYGSPGAGALPHFFGLLVGKAAGVEMLHVPYAGTPPALSDLMGGQIPLVTSTASEFVQLHRAGKIRVIATSGKQRLPLLSEVPTFGEAGIGIEGVGWYGVFAPAKTPSEMVARMSKALIAAIAMPDVQARFETFGLRPTGTTPDQLGAIQKADARLWEPIVKASGFRAD